MLLFTLELFLMIAAPVAHIVLWALTPITPDSMIMGRGLRYKDA